MFHDRRVKARARLALLLVWLGSALAHAAPLDLTACVRLAVAHNPTLYPASYAAALDPVTALRFER